MLRPFLIVSQSDYLIQIIDINSHTKWQTVQIQISWLLQKPTDLDLNCLQRQDKSGFSRTRVNNVYLMFSIICNENRGLQVSTLLGGFSDFSSRKHAYIFNPIKPHFYIVKLGFTGVYIIFLISAQKHRLWILVRTASSRRF